MDNEIININKNPININMSAGNEKNTDTANNDLLNRIKNPINRDVIRENINNEHIQNKMVKDDNIAIIVKGGSVILKIAPQVLKEWGGVSDFDANVVFNNNPTTQVVDVFAERLHECCGRIYDNLPDEMNININNKKIKLQTPIKYIEKDLQNLWYTTATYTRQWRGKKIQRTFEGLNILAASKMLVMMNQFHKRSKIITKTTEGGAIITYGNKHVFNYYVYNYLSTPVDTVRSCCGFDNMVNYPWFNLFHLLRLKSIYLNSEGQKVYPEILDLSAPQPLSGKYINFKKLRENIKNGYYDRVDNVLYNGISKTVLDCASFLNENFTCSGERETKCLKRIKIFKKVDEEKAMKLINNNKTVMALLEKSNN